MKGDERRERREGKEGRKEGAGEYRKKRDAPYLRNRDTNGKLVADCRLQYIAVAVARVDP
jgi:hypothetical protein